MLTHQTPVKERHRLIERFRDGTSRLLATRRVFNEGSDVPGASVAVVLSGTATERESILRLGRMLRQARDEQAGLYELVTEGTSEERVSRQRRGQWQARGKAPAWEDPQAPH